MRSKSITFFESITSHQDHGTHSCVTFCVLYWTCVTSFVEWLASSSWVNYTILCPLSQFSSSSCQVKGNNLVRLHTTQHAVVPSHVYVRIKFDCRHSQAYALLSSSQHVWKKISMLQVLLMLPRGGGFDSLSLQRMMLLLKTPQRLPLSIKSILDPPAIDLRSDQQQLPEAHNT